MLAEYSATVVGMEILRSKSEEVEEEAEKGCSSISHWDTIFSELEAVEHILRN